MNETDRKLRNLAESEKFEIPDSVRQKIDSTLDSLPDGKIKRFNHAWVKIACSAAAVIIAIFIALPNMSPSICSAMSDIPVLGGLIKVVTFREYKCEDDNVYIDVDMPVLESGTDTGENLEEIIGDINGEISDLTDELLAQIEQIREETEGQMHAAATVKYDVVRDDDSWFTLCVEFLFVSGSSNTVYKYYNIDRNSGTLVSLGDLFESDEYIEAINEEILRQMKQETETDDNAMYWSDDSLTPFKGISSDMNFYFSQSGNLVLVFEKYEIAPGYMGCPSFEIPREIYGEYLKSGY
jgi:hypothetical protein